LNVIKSVLSSGSFCDIARNVLGVVDRRLAELTSGPADATNTDSPSTHKGTRFQTLLSSIFPEPEESGWIESRLTQGVELSGEVVCQFIQKRFSQ
jgi:hypothetical protein